MTTLPGPYAASGRVPFRARARLIRLLGEELISSEVMALVELVKNAYDADARVVLVRVLNPRDVTSTSIEVVDDGDGMSLDTVLHGWMEPAASAKRQGRGKRRTTLGRLPLGEKGVGRFAADKLGGEMELVTRARGAAEEVVLRVGWHAFEGDEYLDDVESTWLVREPREFTGRRHGTVIRVHRVRTMWDEALLTRVRDGLARLVSPHASQCEFMITLDCPEYLALQGPVVNQLLEGAPHLLQGDVDTDGMLHIRGQDDDREAVTVDLRGLAAEHFGADGTLRRPVCGPFSLSLRVWDLDAGGRRPPSTDRTTRAALRASSGVSIYRDGFRVMPYGERGDDWLELNQRRVNNPTMRVSNNQIVGIVEITHRHNPDLRDRTSREGVVDTPAFFDFRALVLAALSVLEERRFALRHADTSSISPGAERDMVLQWVDRARMQAQDGTGVRLALQEIERTYRQRETEHQARYEHVVRLAGIGLAAERMTREFARTLDATMVTLRTVLNEASSLQSGGALVQHVKSLYEQYELLDEQLALMAPLYHASSRDVEDLDVRGVVYDLTRVLAYRLRESRVQVIITQEDRLTVRINRGHLMQVLLCLFDNALDALDQMGPGHQGKIQVHVVTGRRGPGLIVADNGHGVRPDARKMIFAPFYAARPERRGLGLHVAQDILAGYNSTISLLNDTTLLPGANFVVKFDRRRVH